MKSLLLVLFIFSAGAEALEKFDLQFALDGSEEQILKAMELRRRDAIERQIYLFDTDKLDLFQRQIQIRLRIEDGLAELGVKRWGMQPADFARMRELFGSQCEIDVHGNTLIRSCAVKKEMPVKKTNPLLSGEIGLLDLFNREQIALLFEGGSPPLVMLRGAEALGPINSRVWEWHDANDSKYSIDIQTLPDDRQFAEFSLKTRTDNVLRKRETLEKHLLGRGLILPTDQHGRRPEKLVGLLNCARLLKAN